VIFWFDRKRTIRICSPEDFFPLDLAENQKRKKGEKQMNIRKISIGLLFLILALVVVQGASAAHSSNMGYPSNNNGVANCQNCHTSNGGPSCNSCGHTGSPTFSLSLVAVPTSVPALSPTAVTLTVSKSNNVKNVKTPASGASVSLNGAGVVTSGTTDAAGIVTKSVNPTGAGTIDVTATLTGFNSGTTTVTVTPAIAALKITAPAAITKVSTGTLTPVSLGTALASGGIAPYTITNNAPAAGFPVGTTTVTWTVKDSTLAKATATQMVTITPATAALKITAPAAITKVSTGTLTPVSLGTALASGGIAP
jgi:hypothetical protein